MNYEAISKITITPQIQAAIDSNDHGIIYAVQYNTMDGVAVYIGKTMNHLGNFLCFKGHPIDEMKKAMVCHAFAEKRFDAMKNAMVKILAK